MGLNCQQLSRKWRCRNSFRRWRSQNLDDRDRKVKIRRGIFTIYHRTLLQHSFAKKNNATIFGIIYTAHASNLDYVNSQIEMQDLRKKRCSNKDYWYYWCLFPPFFLVLISPRLNLWGSWLWMKQIWRWGESDLKFGSAAAAIFTPSQPVSGAD